MSTRLISVYFKRQFLEKERKDRIMNIRSFVNLFEEIPDIIIKSESTCPAGYTHTLGMNEHELNKPNGKPKLKVFSGNNIISRISILSNGKLLLHVEGFHEEDRPATLREILQCMMLAPSIKKLGKIIFHISNYDMECASINGDIPKFFSAHPEYLDRSVMTLSYKISFTSIDTMIADIYIRLDHDIDSIFQLSV